MYIYLFFFSWRKKENLHTFCLSDEVLDVNLVLGMFFLHFLVEIICSDIIRCSPPESWLLCIDVVQDGDEGGELGGDIIPSALCMSDENHIEPLLGVTSWVPLGVVADELPVWEEECSVETNSVWHSGGVLELQALFVAN